MTPSHSEAVEQIRRFDRFYEKLLRKAVRAAANEDFSAADVAVLNELGWADGGCPGAWLGFRLDLDTGYLCRVLKKLEAFGLVAAVPSLADLTRLVEAMQVIEEILGGTLLRDLCDAHP